MLGVPLERPVNLGERAFLIDGRRASSTSTDARMFGARILSYMGDSVGRWDGPALVVETTNFNERGGVNRAFQPRGTYDRALHAHRRSYAPLRYAGVLQVQAARCFSMLRAEGPCGARWCWHIERG